MQITVADIDRLAPPKDAAEFLRRALGQRLTAWAAWQSTEGTWRIFGVRIAGRGWDVFATWSVPNDGAPYLGSLLHRESGGEWSTCELDAAYALNAARRILGEAL